MTTGETVEEVTGSAPLRLFRAAITDLWVLRPHEPGRPCTRHGRVDDHRACVIAQSSA